MDVFGKEWEKEHLVALLEWLQDKRGIPFWDWVKDAKEWHHNYASRPLDDNPIRGIIESQRNLEAENSFCKVENFVSAIKEILKNS